MLSAARTHDAASSKTYHGTHFHLIQKRQLFAFFQVTRPRWYSSLSACVSSESAIAASSVENRDESGVGGHPPPKVP
jgi:hypothetical protein